MVVADSAIDARGLFATAALPAGTVVARLRGTEVDDQDLRRLIATASAYVDSIALDADRNLVLAPGQPIHYGNHSCEPTLWHGDALTLVTRRAVAAGEELTVDYATQTDHAEFRMACQCGAPRCRGTVTGEDWRDPTWQAVYRDHVVPAACPPPARAPSWGSTRRIGPADPHGECSVEPAREAAPLRPPPGSWWPFLRTGRTAPTGRSPYGWRSALRRRRSPHRRSGC